MLNSSKPSGRLAVVLASALAFSAAACAQEEQDAADAGDAGAAEEIVLAQNDAPASTPAADAGGIGVPSGTYVIEPSHAYLNVSYNHLGFSNPTIAFRTLDATINFDAENPANSSVSATIDIDSLDTGVGHVSEFEEHIRDERFFDLANYPTATFQSTSVEVTGANTGRITGDLTIRDQTHPVTLDVVLNQAANHPMRRTPALGFGATTSLNRSEFGAGAFTPNVSDAVQISFEGEFILEE